MNQGYDFLGGSFDNLNYIKNLNPIYKGMHYWETKTNVKDHITKFMKTIIPDSVETFKILAL